MNYIIIYLEVKHLLNFLTKEDKGNLLDALIEYGETKKLPECNQNVLNVFNYLKPKIDTQREKAELKAKVARDNGASGGRPKGDKKPKRTQLKSKETQSVIERQINYPAFINKTLLDDFFAFRHSIATTKKPFTAKAQELIIKKLSEFEAKQQGSANKALENSIENSWQGVFEPKRLVQEQKQQSSGSYLDYLTGGK